MIAPQLALVKPRVTASDGSEGLLEDRIQEFIAAGACGCVAVLGPAGAGKTTALQHLAAVLPASARVVLVDTDEGQLASLYDSHLQHVVVYTGRKALSLAHLAIFRLTPWQRDDLIEYLLRRHRDRCASVMRRIPAMAGDDFGGLPEIWTTILDQLAADELLPNVNAALRRFLEQQLPDTDIVQRSRNACLNLLTAAEAESRRGIDLFAPPGLPASLSRLLRQPAVQYLLAAERIIADLEGGGDCDYLKCRLPIELLHASGRLVENLSAALDRLGEFMNGPPWRHAMSASLLHLAKSDWRPDGAAKPYLAHAYLRGVQWAGINLENVDLEGADLKSADLSGAMLDGANMSQAQLGRARLHAASLNNLIADEVNLAGAILSLARGEYVVFEGANLCGAMLDGATVAKSSFVGANLTSAVLAQADLQKSNFCEADLRDADFSGADLTGANLAELKLRRATFRDTRFAKANLSECDLEYVDFASADFRGADLTKALLTGSTIINGNLDGACLRETGLGDINWENCTLRDADLTGAAFHMGSSRSGLLFTNIASEGTRTGFYTDDYDDQSFKEPEEIRKANLCGCDLRGAKVLNVDFYLVDLRGAVYDAEQEAHFRRCGAILGT